MSPTLRTSSGDANLRKAIPDVGSRIARTQPETVSRSVHPHDRPSTVMAMTGDLVLIVEDDERIGVSLSRALEANGYNCVWATTGAQALEILSNRSPQLALLDIGLPDLDGLEVCRRAHTIQPNLDIIMLTARDDELDIVAGLDAGAVDYITKPFKLAELLARIRAQLRRTDSLPAGQIQIGELTVDTRTRRVFLANIEVQLRAKEFDLLARLALDIGNTLTRHTLMSDVWDEHWFGSTKTLDFHVAALRQKLDTGYPSSWISTIRGVGFRFDSPVRAAALSDTTRTADSCPADPVPGGSQ